MRIQWTPEQVTILDCDDPVIRIKAFAGAAKTTTLVQYAKLRPQKRFLYLAFNKSVKTEAAEKFPKKNVKVSTTHGLAYATYGRQFQHKLSKYLRLSVIADVLCTQDWAYVKIINDTLNGFMASGDDSINDSHLPSKSRARILSEKSGYLMGIFQDTQTIWEKMIDPEDTTVPCLHSAYLKLFSISSPDLSEYDGILVDEAQDISPVTFAFLLKQSRCQRIYVGDPSQQIYRFLGADNALDHPSLAGSTNLTLSSSFRFGPAIAGLANVLLAYKGETRPVIGAGYRTQIKTALPPETTQPAFINRTVMGVLDTAIHASSTGKKVFWVGGIDAYNIGTLEDLHKLATKDPSKVQNKRLLKDYEDFGQYEEVAEETQDSEMKRAVRIVKKYDNLSTLLLQMRKMTVSKLEDADVVVTTAHRVKGLEFDYVMMLDDFPDPLDPMMDPADAADEINLNYVAATRAKKVLVPNSVVIGMIRDHAARTKNNQPIPVF
ncbi:3'-5' exonuclease [Pseudomonas aeruginosa]